SLLHMIGALYAPWQGSVRVLGRDPRAMPEDEHRQLIGVVPQALNLFSGSILDNLTLNDRTVPFAAVVSAAEMTGLDDIVGSLPDGYATELGGTGRGAGVQLSAGQQQLLALTRALVWDPPVILLDEATSAIDSASDATFRAALHDLVKKQNKA